MSPPAVARSTAAAYASHRAARTSSSVVNGRISRDSVSIARTLARTRPGRPESSRDAPDPAVLSLTGSV